MNAFIAVRRSACQRCGWLYLVLIALLIGCSANSDSGDGNHSADGGIGFRLSWNDVKPQAESADYPQLISGDVCEDYNIQWIYGKAIDQTGKEQSTGKWLCTDRQGELTGVPEGSYDVIVQGEVEGDITWRGEASGIDVIKKQKTDAGVINMTHLFDQDAPTVVQTVPDDGEQGAPVNSAVTASFDNAIVAQSITAENFILTHTDQTNGDSEVECSVTYDVNNHIAVLTPTVDLRNNSTYTATILADKNPIVEDMAGNPMQQTIQWTFTTYQPDNEGPNIVTRSPAHGEMKAALQTIVQIRFSESINPVTITSDSIYLHHNGTEIQCALAYDDQLNMVTLTPAGNLPAGTTCRVVVTTDITDLSGNALESDDTWAFVTRFASWKTEDTGKTQKMTLKHIALTTNDRPHICMTDPGDKLIDVSRTSPNTWEEDSLTGNSTVSYHHDMVIDRHDVRHTIYWLSSKELLVVTGSVDPGFIRMARLDPNNQQLDPQGVCIAYAENDPKQGAGVYTCYYDAAASELVFAAEHTNWALNVVDSNAGEYPSLAVEPTGEAHISYFDAANGHLKYATNASGEWVAETIDNSENVGLYTSIAVDATGLPQISYLDDANNHLKYATKQVSGKWLIETVDNSVQVSSNSSIALDSLGLPHISFYDQSNSNLMYATRTAIGTWHVAVADDYGKNGLASSIIVDSENYVHIAYGFYKTSIANEFLGYATTRP